jgi:hypothetical protein
MAAGLFLGPFAGYPAPCAWLLPSRAVAWELPCNSSERLEYEGALYHVTTGIYDKATRNQRIHRAMRIHGCTFKELSEHLHLHYSTISVIAKQVEAGLKGQKEDLIPSMTPSTNSGSSLQSSAEEGRNSGTRNPGNSDGSI